MSQKVLCENLRNYIFHISDMHALINILILQFENCCCEYRLLSDCTHCLS